MSAVAGFPIHRGVLAVGLRGAEPDAAGARPALARAGAGARARGPDQPRQCRRRLPQRRRLRGRRGAAGRGELRSALPQEHPGLGRGRADPALRAAPARRRIGCAARRPSTFKPLALSPGASRDPGRTVAVPARALLILGTEGPGLDAATLDPGTAGPHPDGRRLRLAQRRHRRGHRPARHRPRSGTARPGVTDAGPCGRNRSYGFRARPARASCHLRPARDTGRPRRGRQGAGHRSSQCRRRGIGVLRTVPHA